MPEHPAGSLASLPRLEPIQTRRAGVLDVGYYEAGPADGRPVLLLHGFPYDIHSYAEVAPLLAGAGLRVVVPYLRGYGPTRFADPATPRSGQQAAIGADIIGLMDALGIDRAILAGYDWGGRGACVAAALWPERCAGLVSNGYLIEDVAASVNPIRPYLEAGLWFFFYFGTERGRRGLAAYRRDLARLVWSQLSPKWQFDDATFDRTGGAFDNPDFVDVVIHSFRHRLGLAPGYPAYADLEQRLAARPAIPVPAITLDGQEGSPNFPATDGTAQAACFTGPRIHRQVPDAGHNLPQENPQAFAAAVLDLARQTGVLLYRGPGPYLSPVVASASTCGLPRRLSASSSSRRELMSSLANTLRRCHSTVRAPMNSWAPISGLVNPSLASWAISASCGVSSVRVSAVRLRTFSPVARSSRRARSAKARAPMDVNASNAGRSWLRASIRRFSRRSHSP
jgi:pimeloyl-ACP methyl ester carboxylesterase